MAIRQSSHWRLPISCPILTTASIPKAPSLSCSKSRHCSGTAPAFTAGAFGDPATGALLAATCAVDRAVRPAAVAENCFRRTFPVMPFMGRMFASVRPTASPVPVDGGGPFDKNFTRRNPISSSGGRAVADNPSPWHRRRARCGIRRGWFLTCTRSQRLHKPAMFSGRDDCSNRRRPTAQSGRWITCPRLSSGRMAERMRARSATHWPMAVNWCA